MTLDSLSNREAVPIPNEWIEQAGEEFKAALRRQLQPEPRAFGLRMSNIGRPTCQLQAEQANLPATRNSYNHILRMLIGDATEIVVSLIVKAAGVNVTNSKTKRSVTIQGVDIHGEDDIEIDGKVYDIKSASPWSFQHKWSEGFNGVYYGDSFGYVAQLWGYANKDPDKMGGWIVVDKSSGELKVVNATPNVDQLKELEDNVQKTVEAISNNIPFERSFQEEDEKFYNKLTGNKIVPVVCTFCNYLKVCWPNATLMPRAGSKAINKKLVWYTDYTLKEDTDED